jgi:hypothetical protein
MLTGPPPKFHGTRDILVGCRLGFDAFGDGGQAEGAGEVDDGTRLRPDADAIDELDNERPRVAGTVAVVLIGGGAERLGPPAVGMRRRCSGMFSACR